jgi:xylulokinase
MAERFVIGHDVGTGGNKAVLASIEGELITCDFKPYPVFHPRANWAEQEPRHWWQAVTESTAELMHKSGVDAKQVIGLGFAGQMLGLIPMSSSGKPLRRAIIWLDSRADEQAERIIRRFGGKRVVINLAGAVPSGKDVICKLIWIKEQEPEIYRDTYRFLDTTGYLVYRATGKMIIDQTGAGGTGIINNKTRDWSPLMARLAGVSLKKMPPVRSCIDVAGSLSEEAAAEMRLQPGTPVIAGMADIPAAATGSGALEDGDAHINIGTSSWLCLSVSRPKNLGKNGIAPVVSADPHMFIMIGESETAGACLEWFATRFSRGDEWERAGDELEIFKVLDEVVEGVEAGSGRLIFTPWMFGERAPVTDTTLRGSFINLGLEHGRDHLLRAVYEGVAYNLRWLLDLVGGAGFGCDPLRAIGGGAKSDVWMQIMADVTRRRIEAVDNPQMAGAMGCALAAAVAAGAFIGYKEIKKVVKVRRTFEPREDCCAVYDELYEVFRCIYPSISGVCSQLNKEIKGSHL